MAFAVPGDLATPTGGYAYDRRIIAELRKLGWQVDVLALGDGFPYPNADTKAQALTTLSSVPRHCPVVIDGLALGVLPKAARVVSEHARLIALVHHPLALETGVGDDAAAFHCSERSALSHANVVVAVSAATSEILVADYGVANERIVVAPPGTDRKTFASGSSDGIVRLLSVGAMTPRKGFDVLIAALTAIPDLPWRLTIVGDRSRDAATAARIDADIARHGLGERIDILGAVSDERLAALYHAADVFVLASHFEGYGMAYAEAIAHGLPVVGTTGGAIPRTVPADAGILVEPGDAGALAGALRRSIENTDERRTLATAARNAAAMLPTWEESATLFSSAIEAVRTA